VPSLAELQADFVRALRDRHAPSPDAVTSHTSARPVARFDVYRRNVHASLIQLLEARFPAVARLTGEEFFRAMALAFVTAALPRSPVLIGYGEDFPDFAERFEPAADLAYLADVARLEWLQHAAYHAADAKSLTATDLAVIPPDALPAVQFRLHPSLRLLTSPYPVLAIWRTNREDTEVKQVALDAGADALLILRPALDVEVRRLPPGAATFIDALAQGQPLAEAAAIASAQSDHFELHKVLAGVISAGAISGYTL
jgi:hypothetical protein